MFLGEVQQRRQRPPHTLVAGREHALIQECHERVDDHQTRIGLAQGVIEPVGLRRETPGPVLVVAFALPDEDPLEVGAQPAEPRHDRVGRVIFGAEYQRVAQTRTGLAVRERLACTQACAKV